MRRACYDYETLDKLRSYTGCTITSPRAVIVTKEDWPGFSRRIFGIEVPFPRDALKMHLDPGHEDPYWEVDLLEVQRVLDENGGPDGNTPRPPED